VKFIVIHNEARGELDAAIAYYEEQKAGLGLDLL
jgi:toxin ParE1/3/4